MMATKIVQRLTPGQIVPKEYSPYERIVADFVHSGLGCFIAVSDDTAFTRTLCSAFTDELQISPEKVLTIISDSEPLLKFIKDADDAGKTPMVLMEKVLAGQDMGFMVKLFKTAYPNALLLILTAETEKHRIVYLHELGADNFIAKPISSRSIIEKIAFTVKPHNELGLKIDKAKALLQDGRPQEARTLAMEILAMKPGSATGLILLGDAENALGNIRQAEKAYLAANESASMYLEPLRRLVSLTEKNGDLNTCLTYLEKLDALSPLNPDSRVNMGEINLNLGNEEKAFDIFNAAMEQVTREAMDRIGALAERVAAIYAPRDPKISEQFLRKVLNVKRMYLSSDDLRIFNQLGISLRRQGKWQQAIDEYNNALHLAPGDAVLHYNLGMAYAEGEDSENACKYMQKALTIRPELPKSSPGVALNMGQIFMKCGNNQKARHCLRMALRFDQTMLPAQAALEKLDQEEQEKTPPDHPA